MKKSKNGRSSLMKRLVPQIVMQGFVIVFTAVTAYMFMTWIVVTVAKVENTYLGAVYEVLGTLFFMVIVLTAMNTYVYRKRTREIDMLSDAISKVASGDFAYRIPIEPRETLSDVYKDFNKMSAELSSLQILRKNFIDSYSHEFKTPIASIEGFAELLLEKDISESERREYLEIIRDESGRLSTLAQNTILLSKLSSQQIVTDTEEYDLGEQLRQCSIICSRSWLSKQQAFSCNLPEVVFRGNRELLQHLWLNLLSNAIKYTPNGGEISLVLAKENDIAVVKVADTGEGMSEETKSHLFTPYYQGNSGRSTQGLGLGLSIAKRIVELCNGEIHVESERGVGSEFTVTLPLEKVNNKDG